MFVFSNTTTLYVHHAFLYIFLCRRCTTTTWKLLISLFWRTWTQENDFLFVFLNFDTIQCLRIHLQRKLPTFDELNEMEYVRPIDLRVDGRVLSTEANIKSVSFWICPEAGFSSNFPSLDTRKIHRRTLFSVTLSRKKPCPVGPSLCTAHPCPLLKNKSLSP